MCGPTVEVWGSDEQKKRYLRPLFTGEEVWCQLFSEPGAGSDFAGLSGRGVRDGDEWIVNGQKVWTTLAHISPVGPARVPHRPRRPQARGPHGVRRRHAGARRRGAAARQMTGEAEFNEVYFTDVRIPDAERLGDPGAGWRVSLTTLMNERVSIGGAIAPKGSGAIGAAVKVWQDTPADQRDPAMKDELMKLWIEAEVNRLTNLRAGANRKMGTPGPEGSTGKLAFAESNKRIYEFTMNLMGANGMLYGEYTMHRPEHAMESSTLQKAFLRSRANSIEGGTSEVMRNILGERVLGLARRRAGRQGRLLERGAAQLARHDRRRRSPSAGHGGPARSTSRIARPPRSSVRGTRRLGPSATPRPSRARGAGTRARALDQRPDSARSRPRARGPGRTRPGHGNTSRGR